MIENKVTEILGQLADKLGVASAKIWEWNIIQVKVDIVTDIILIAFQLVLIMVFAWLLRRFMREKDDLDYEAEEFCGGGLIVFAIILIVLGIAITFTVSDLPKLLINPEYAAFENIVEQLGSLK